MVQIPRISHLKSLDIRNLQCEIRMCQKGHNKVTNTVLSLLRFFMRQTLVPPGTAVVMIFYALFRVKDTL